ncbi:MAG: transglutaminase domain-containing protein, partial [Muribaculaceae bacterium]|nr:transglutaminase domain-containing protein [Muribaculaceae bacterium]
VVLENDANATGQWEWDMVPPAPSANIPELDEDQVRVNDERKVREDSIRNAYTSTFMTEESGREFARSIGAGSSADKIAALLVASRGNHAVIADFLRRHIADAPAVELLEVISDKDLRDIPAEVLEDHVATAKVATPLYAEYILNPRVSNEMLTPYKAYFRQAIPADMQAAFVADPRKWVEWCADSIALDSKWNPQRLRMTPRSVYTGRVTDAGSRDIFFVTAARSMGIPARIDPVTGKPQYADNNGKWNDADFAAAAKAENAPQGQLRLAYTPAGRMTDPQYYYHFTLSKIANGSPALLNYPDDAAWSSTFRNNTDLDAGQYLMVSGQRMADGTVLAKASLFAVDVGNITAEQLV